jgi:hypothetical protein
MAPDVPHREDPLGGLVLLGKGLRYDYQHPSTTTPDHRTWLPHHCTTSKDPGFNNFSIVSDGLENLVDTSSSDAKCVPNGILC